MNLRIRVDECIDMEDCYVWTLVDPDGGEFCYGYSGSEAEAWNDAKIRRKEEMNLLL